MEYHEKKKKARQTKDNKKPKKVDPIEVVDDIVENDESNETFMEGEFLSDELIEDDKLSPIKVLNITHIKGDEKKLVAHILFEGSDEPSFVYATWANKHCPELVIAYYESRIHWEQKS